MGVIFVNFFCQAHDIDWMHNLVLIEEMLALVEAHMPEIDTAEAR